MPETQFETQPGIGLERLRILQVIPSLGIGGAEQMVGHLLLGLSKSHHVAGVSLYPPRESPVESRLRDARIPLWYLGKRRGLELRMFPALAKVLREFRPQIVHTHLSVLRYVLPALLSYPAPLVVHTLHNLAEHETDAIGRAIQRLAFRRAVLPVAISQEVAASVERFYGLQSSAIIPNGIPVDRYQSVPDERTRWREAEGFHRDSILFTCVARLEPQKNPFLLLRAFAAVKDTRAHLVLLGSGSLMAPLKAHVHAHGLEGRVHVLGKRDNVRECLAASDVFVLSSNWEGNPLAVMEAMAAGLPVISTAVGGVPDLVRSGEQGILVPPEDCLAFTQAMRLLFDDSAKRTAMGRAARARASTAFRVERMVEGYVSLYRATLMAGSSLPASSLTTAAQRYRGRTDAAAGSEGP
jgi:glycosyltransferase involved in cell wall biosynthesis